MPSPRHCLCKLLVISLLATIIPRLLLARLGERSVGAIASAATALLTCTNEIPSPHARLIIDAEIVCLNVWQRAVVAVVVVLVLLISLPLLAHAQMVLRSNSMCVCVCC